MPGEIDGDPASTPADADEDEAEVGSVDASPDGVQAATDPTTRSTSAIPGNPRQEPVTIRSSLPGPPDAATLPGHIALRYATPVRVRRNPRAS
jgi:hypothetical protein